MAEIREKVLGKDVEQTEGTFYTIVGVCTAMVSLEKGLAESPGDY